jgi:hypothetical protein
MLTKYIFGALAAVFLLLAAFSLARGSAPQIRTWLLIAVIFAVISGYLFFFGT